MNESTTKRHYPIGVRDGVRPGKGIPENCIDYSEVTGYCYHIGPESDGNRGLKKFMDL